MTTLLIVIGIVYIVCGIIALAGILHTQIKLNRTVTYYKRKMYFENYEDESNDDEIEK